MKSLITLFIAVSFVFISCNGQNTEPIQTVDAKTYADKITSTPNAQILDVRTPDEFATGHIENADNVDWLADSFVLKTDKYDKSKPVYVYCKVGGRSAKAAAKLAELGFTSVYNLEGGFLKWEAAGLAKPNDKIIGITTKEYAKLIQNNKKVLINFHAPWCAPCKKMEPYVLKMQKDLKDKVVIIRLNADENKTIMQALKISELPALLLYENNTEKWKNSGYISQDELMKQLN